jgi:hypothetical protein
MSQDSCGKMNFIQVPPSVPLRPVQERRAGAAGRGRRGAVAVALFFKLALCGAVLWGVGGSFEVAAAPQKNERTGSQPLEGGPDPLAVLRGVRESQAAIHQTLHGRLRMGARKLPYRMIMNGGDLRFEFPEAQAPDPQVVSLSFGSKDAAVKVQSTEGAVKRAQFADEIAGMGVLYEDLAMRFLYWTEAEVEGEERLMPPLYLRCWKIRVHRPSGVRSVYKEVVVWVSQDNGGILKSEAYDDTGALVRRLKVVSVQSLDQKTTLKQMRIESPQKGGAFVYLDVDGNPGLKISK